MNLKRILPAVFGLAMISCQKQDKKAGGPPSMMDRVQAVEVMPIRKMTLRETVGLVGTIAANESATLRSEISGTVREISFEEGQEVKAGQVLAKVDTRELEAQIQEMNAKFELAGKSLSRNRSLFSDAAVSKVELDASVAEEAQLKASMALLQVRLEKSEIRAPFDGVANGRTVSIGDYLTPDTVLTTVDDLSRLKVEIQVPERYLPKLESGGEFTLKTATSRDAGEMKGKVYFVSSRIDAATRATLVKGYVLDPPEYVKPGMFATVSLMLETVEDALVVPETAIMGSSRGSMVICPKQAEKGKVAEFVPVKTGLRVPGLVQIIPVGNDLKEGDEIVSAGVGGLILIPGMTLKTVEPLVTSEVPERTDRVLEGSK
ncbi:MAG: efflux RND transporter periplasmic adaptor subunit [Armatimonadetes bacterium]|nr:efflux RND transporter periplasmic adaptor subunit [Akkermansiaceae bacterium]